MLLYDEYAVKKIIGREVILMFKEAIEHYTNSIHIYAVDEQTLTVRLKAKKGDLKECIFFYGNRVSPVDPVPMSGVPMILVASDFLFDYFEVELTVEYNRICYSFWLNDGLESIYYYSNEFHNSLPLDRNEYYQFPYLRREEIYNAPEWAEKAVIYQIFPDSFATGKHQLIADQTVYRNHLEGESHGRCGGNLQGIIDNLPYLSELGINCLYLTPIFTANSYHKYDTGDYFTIDPCFGDTETLKELVNKAHERGIKVILDGVFNHCGPDFFAFRDVLAKGEKSQYKDWFYHLEFPVCFEDPPNYECFAYVKEMPKLNTGNPEVRDYFLKVGTYWIKETNIDGWRLDVANEVDHYFWKCFRQAVKAVKPEVILIGEIWGDAQTWLMGDEFDSTMNYRFTNLCCEFFAERKIGVYEFDAKFNHLLMRYPRPITNLQMNLLDSHDVPRFLSKCHGDIRRFKLAILFQMMVPGIPSIFYGDEIGLTGIKETDYRQPMNWELIGGKLFSYYKKVISLRTRFAKPMTGKFSSFLKDQAKDVYGFIREKDDEKIYVLLNNSEHQRTVEFKVEGKERLTDLLNNKEYILNNSTLKLKLPPISGVVLY